jgi:hypothetical protein
LHWSAAKTEFGLTAAGHRLGMAGRSSAGTDSQRTLKNSTGEGQLFISILAQSATRSRVGIYFQASI